MMGGKDRQYYQNCAMKFLPCGFHDCDNINDISNQETTNSVKKLKAICNWHTAQLQIILRYTYTLSVSALAVGCGQKNTISTTPTTPTTVRMMKSVVLDSAVMTVSPANRKYTMRLPNSRLTKPTY